MPVERTYIDGIRDWLTLPARLDPAFWEGLEALYGKGSAGTVMNVLFNPIAAKPEDLANFSDRFLHLSNGWAKFAADTLFSPTLLFGLGFAKGSAALRLQGVDQEGNAARKQFAQQWAPAADKFSLKNYAELLDRMGFKISRGAEIIKNVRSNKMMSEFVPIWEDIR